MSQTKPICLHRIFWPTEDNSCETEDNSPGGGWARGAAREPCKADGSRDHGEAMTLSLAGIGVHGGCRQCTRGLGACGVVFVIMQRRCGCGCAAGAHWPLPMLQVVGRAWISFQSTLAAPGRNSILERVRGRAGVRLVWIALSSGAGGSTGGAFLGFGTTSGFMGKPIWIFV